MTLPRPRVLIVEDNPVIAFDLQDALAEAGMAVIGPALDLASGLELAQGSALDGAVLDIDIAGTPVWPVARTLAERSIPFLFVSADCADTLPEEFRAVVCLDKPAASHEVIAALRETIARP